jgi:hypothetical protein
MTTERPSEDRADDPHKLGLACCARLMERAVLTLRVLPERDRPRGFHNAWPTVIHDVSEAYGYTAARPPRFRPSPRDISNMLPALGWITWLEAQSDGKRDAAIIVARAFGISWWLLGERFRRGERTIRRWYDTAVLRIYAAFETEVLLLAR